MICLEVYESFSPVGQYVYDLLAHQESAYSLVSMRNVHDHQHRSQAMNLGRPR